jgi:hypothetical protein
VSFQNRDDDLTAGAGGHQKSAKVIESHQYRAMQRPEPGGEVIKSHKKSPTAASGEASPHLDSVNLESALTKRAEQR